MISKVTPILEADGRVWVPEAGQSDFTADWTAQLLENGIDEKVIKNQILVVQHSHWNESKTTAAELNYVREKTTYITIDDGNTQYGDTSKRADRGPCQTPKCVSASPIWMEAATSSENTNKATRALWTEAGRLIRESGFNGIYSAISKGGVDFSDCVEVWFIFGLEGKADSVEQFWGQYVVPQP